MGDSEVTGRSPADDEQQPPASQGSGPQDGLGPDGSIYHGGEPVPGPQDESGPDGSIYHGGEPVPGPQDVPSEPDPDDDDPAVDPKSIYHG
jgi:hypothetical protein